MKQILSICWRRCRRFLLFQNINIRWGFVRQMNNWHRENGFNPDVVCWYVGKRSVFNDLFNREHRKRRNAEYKCDESWFKLKFIFISIHQFVAQTSKLASLGRSSCARILYKLSSPVKHSPAFSFRPESCWSFIRRRRRRSCCSISINKGRIKRRAVPRWTGEFGEAVKERDKSYR